MGSNDHQPDISLSQIGLNGDRSVSGNDGPILADFVIFYNPGAVVERTRWADVKRHTEQNIPDLVGIRCRRSSDHVFLTVPDGL